MIKGCWNCGMPFMLGHYHKRTGYVIRHCANPGCNAPADLNDDIALTIMEDQAKRDPEAKQYVAEWRAARKT